jgi:hypothetical protein
MNGLRKPNRPMPTGAKSEEGRPQGQPSSAEDKRLKHEHGRAQISAYLAPFMGPHRGRRPSAFQMRSPPAQERCGTYEER